MKPCTCHGPQQDGKHEDCCTQVQLTADELFALGWYWSPDRGVWVYDRPEGGQDIGAWEARP